MALIKCEECGKEISDKAESCPHCGCPVYESKKNISLNANNKKRFNMFVMVILILLIISAVIIHFKTDNKAEKTNFESIDINYNETSDDLNDEQLNILKKLKGTWELNNDGDIYRYTFSGMQVQYYCETAEETMSYTTSLTFSKRNDVYYLVDDYDSNNRIYYCLFNDNLSVNTYNNNVLAFLRSIPDKVSDNDDFIAVPKIGMTKYEVENTMWGKPKDINKTTTVSGTSEQWVYDGYRYVYFDNGIVTSIQE